LNKRSINQAIAFDPISNAAANLQRSILLTAEWRRGLVERYPDDSRNGDAAELLEKIAADTDQVPAGELRDYRFFDHRR
jgi:hypothetical protein